MNLQEAKIGIIGLGYVGLPLAVEFGKRYPTIGFDINHRRIEELKRQIDRTGEVTTEELSAARFLRFSGSPDDLRHCNVYIVAVPTPVDTNRHPDLRPLIRASELVGKVISSGDIVIYESTVYPGATEDDCIPVIARISGLEFNKEFFAGYSPERVSPGDKARPFTKIIKITSGSTVEAAEFIDKLYKSIITAGTYPVSSIKVAESAKIVENIQRDVNIALMNELSIVFSYLGIDTNDVLDAAGSKWNFVRLRPGLVGGHCIGVDPYYLVHKSIAAGFIPDIIRTAREINDGMARNAASRLVKTMISRDISIKKSKVLVIGFTFKEDCPDTRNTKVVDFVKTLSEYGINVDVVDNWIDPEDVFAEYGLTVNSKVPLEGQYDAVVLAVAHRDLIADGSERLRMLLKDGGVFFDMKGALPKSESDLRL